MPIGKLLGHLIKHPLYCLLARINRPTMLRIPYLNPHRWGPRLDYIFEWSDFAINNESMLNTINLPFLIELNCCADIIMLAFWLVFRIVWVKETPKLFDTCSGVDDVLDWDCGGNIDLLGFFCHVDRWI